MAQQGVQRDPDEPEIVGGVHVQVVATRNQDVGAGVEVFGGADVAVRRQGVRADDEVVDLMGDERGQQLDEVAVHRWSRWEGERRPCAKQGTRA